MKLFESGSVGSANPAGRADVPPHGRNGRDPWKRDADMVIRIRFTRRATAPKVSSAGWLGTPDRKFGGESPGHSAQKRTSILEVPKPRRAHNIRERPSQKSRA